MHARPVLKTIVRIIHGIAVLLLTLAALMSITKSRPPFDAALPLQAAGKALISWSDAAPTGAELSSFTGDRSGRHVNLEWVTSREANAGVFELQRASSVSRGWEVLAEIPAIGNSTLEQHYLYTDRSAPPEDLRYMLRIRSRDGSVQYSQIISVLAGRLLGTFVLDGPTDRYGKIFRTTVTLRDSARIALNLTDRIGQTLVRVLPPRIVAGGTHTYQVDCASLPQGSYALHLHTPEGKFSRTLHLR